jgi:diguanylate cyclase (GGDEF)-like protein
LLLISAWADFMPDWAALVQLAYHWAGMASFYVLIRFNHTLKRTDRAMAFEQVVFAVSALVLSYALSPESRGASLQLLCLALAFDMQRLTSKQLSTAAWSAVALLCITLAITWWVRPEPMNLRREIFNLVMAGIQLPALSLVARDVRWLRSRQLQQRVDLQEALSKLQEVSQRDALTGLFNRYHMSHLIEQEVKRFARNGRHFAVAIVDIDHFKLVNDRHGHAVGDAVLQTFARLATDYLSHADAIARWGGEEFLVLMPEQTIYQGMATVDGLRRHIEQFDWAPISPGLSVRFSAGVTELHLPKENEDQLLARADQALYRAKSAGRNRVFSEPEATST